ncbi:MAG TPA: hypothetical protein VGC86_15950 [Afipia sp.]
MPPLKALFYIDSLAMVSHCIAAAETLRLQAGAHIVAIVFQSAHSMNETTRLYEIYDYSILRTTGALGQSEQISKRGFRFPKTGLRRALYLLIPFYSRRLKPAGARLEKILRAATAAQRRRRQDVRDFLKDLARKSPVLHAVLAVAFAAGGLLEVLLRLLTAPLRFLFAMARQVLLVGPRVSRLSFYAASIDNFLQTTRPDVIILPELNIETLSNVFVVKGRAYGIPTVLTPFTIPNPAEPARHYRHNPLHRADIAPGRWVAKQYPKWRFDYEGRPTLRLPALLAWAIERSGFSTPAPWILNRGEAAAIALDSAAQRDFYLGLGFPAEQLKVTGDLNYTIPFHDCSDKARLEEALRLKYGFQPDRPLIVCGFPPDQYVDATGHGFEFPSYEALIDAWMAAFKSLGDKANILIRPHPRIPVERLAAYETANIKLSREPTANLIPLCDLYVASISATIRWAVSCGIPVVNYDTYRYCYSDFESAPGVVHVKNASDFHASLNRFVDDPAFAADIAERQRSVMNYWGCADGKSPERFAALVKDVVERAAERRVAEVASSSATS